ncbi:MAG: DUF2283 domain-containing protein [Methanobrevibacter sp.]|nr:DUF2283 domain-containing protein [Methanosphaera sp.]MBR0369217.1 DUF2283 domain-containing protein [Methanobrevibacter sp.]
MVSILNFSNLMYRYSPEVDALYCKINLPYIYDYTIPVNPIFNIDICEVKEVVAFELLDASKVLKVTPDDLLKDKPRIKITVQVTTDVIKVVFNILTSTGEMGGFSVKALNENNASVGVYYYST